MRDDTDAAMRLSRGDPAAFERHLDILAIRAKRRPTTRREREEGAYGARAERPRPEGQVRRTRTGHRAKTT